MVCKTYPLETLGSYKFVVVLSSYQGKWMLSRHKDRTTWETQGGHIETGEQPIDAAKRELYEESGATDFKMEPAFDYWAGEGENGSKGMVFLAEIEALGRMPESEMAEIAFFDTLPENLTYPDISSVLFEKVAVEKRKQ